VSLHFLHRYQVRQHLGDVLDQARSAEAAGKLDKAIEHLRRYLATRSDNGEIWALLARTMDKNTPAATGGFLLYDTFLEATRLNPDDPGIRRRTVVLGLELERWNDALNHIRLLLDRAGGDNAGGPDAAELEDQLGQCYQGKFDFKDAEKRYRQAIAHDPARISTYGRLARMLRDRVRDAKKADRVIDEMVKTNSRMAGAYLERWNYCRQYGLPLHDGDVYEALELAPEDADALAAAAELALRRGQVAGPSQRDRFARARHLAKRGLDLHPELSTFYLLSAMVELVDSHSDQAEAILHRGIEALPSRLELPFLLADLLISRKKLDGENGAEAWIERLRGRLRDGQIEYLESRVLVASERWIQAITKITTARTLLMSDPVLLGRLTLMLAGCLAQTGDEETRLTALKQAAMSSEEPTATSARQSLAQALENVGRLEEALSQYVLLSKARPEALYDVARVSIERTRRLPRGRQQWDQAKERVRQGKQALPRATVDLALLDAGLLVAQQRPREARQALESALAASPKDPRLWVSLAGILRSQGEWAEALKTLDRAEKALGRSLDLTLAWINVWSRRGGDEAGRALASLADTKAKSSPEDLVRLLDALGMAWLRLGERDRAREAWRELLQKQSGNRRVLMQLIELAIEAGDHPEARQLASRLRELEGGEGTQWRYAEVQILIDLARRGDLKVLDQVPALIGEISLRRGAWWGVDVLKAQVAEAEDRPEEAIQHYLDAIKEGNTQPGLVRRAVSLLYRMQEFDQIDALVEILASQGVEPEDLKLVTALNALRRGERDRAIAIARQTLPQASSDPFDHVGMGQILQAAGRTQEAAAEFHRALELGPRIPGVWLAQVRHLVKSGQTDKARAAVEAADKALPREVAAAALAQCYALIGHTEQADSHFQAALAARPGDPGLLQLAAEFYIGRKLRAKAEPLLARLLDPATGASPADQAWARRSQGQLELQSGSPGRIEAAIRLVEENLKVNPSSFDDQRARVLLLALQPGHRSEAIADLKGRDQSLDPEQRFLLALLHLADNDREKCEQDLRKLLDAKDRARDSKVLALMVRVQLDLNHLDDAARWLADLKRQESSSPRVLELECRLLKAQKQDSKLLALLQAYARDHASETSTIAALFEQFGFPREAEEAYRKPVAEKPRDPERLTRLISFLGRRNRPQEALELWEQTLTVLTPEAAADLAVLVVSMPSATDVQRAKLESWINQALQTQPGSLTLRMRLAYVRMKQGCSADAQALYRQVLMGSPENVEALNNLALLLSFEEKTRDEASKLIERAIDLGNSAPPLLDTRALVCLQRGETQRALMDLRQALSAGPEDPVYHYHLVRAYEQAGKEPEARKAFEQAERLGLKRGHLDPVEWDEYDRLRKKLHGD
jgi:tetratricopeptide (TPR) repeat protein